MIAGKRRLSAVINSLHFHFYNCNINKPGKVRFIARRARKCNGRVDQWRWISNWQNIFLSSVISREIVKRYIFSPIIAFSFKRYNSWITLFILLIFAPIILELLYTHIMDQSPKYFWWLYKYNMILLIYCSKGTNDFRYAYYCFIITFLINLNFNIFKQ